MFKESTSIMFLAVYIDYQNPFKKKKFEYQNINFTPKMEQET